MQLRLTKISSESARRHLRTLSHLPVNYWERGGTDWVRMPQGYKHYKTEVCVGEGADCWRAARAIFKTWAFMPDYVRRSAEVRSAGNERQYLIDVRKWGLHWIMPLRIIYSHQSSDTLAVAVGTLPGHVAIGEERFELHRDAAGKVWFRIRVMSRIRLSIAKLVPGIFARVQEKFRADCVVQFKQRLANYADKREHRTIIQLQDELATGLVA